MSIKDIIREAMEKNPLGLREAVTEELRNRVSLALEAKMKESDCDDEDDEDEDEDDEDDDEDDDQLDELSKNTLASYVKKAGAKAEKSWDNMKTQQKQSAKFASLAHKNHGGAGVVGAEYDKKSSDAWDKARQHEKDYDKRADGWELANKKLAGKAKVNPKS
jgi:hypothetical protein